MTATHEDTIQDIQDPNTRGRLEGVQSVVFSLDEEMGRVRKAMEEKRCVVGAARAIHIRLQQEHLVVNKEMDAGKITHDTAKIQSDTIKRLVDIVRGVEAENHSDYTKLQGQVTALENVAKISENIFNGEVGKYERWKRIEAEEALAAEPLPLQVPAGATNGDGDVEGVGQAKAATPKASKKQSAPTQKKQKRKA